TLPTGLCRGSGRISLTNRSGSTAQSTTSTRTSQYSPPPTARRWRANGLPNHRPTPGWFVVARLARGRRLSHDRNTGVLLGRRTRGDGRHRTCRLGGFPRGVPASDRGYGRGFVPAPGR